MHRVDAARRQGMGLHRMGEERGGEKRWASSPRPRWTKKEKHSNLFPRLQLFPTHADSLIYSKNNNNDQIPI